MKKGTEKEGREREWNIKYSHPPPLAGGGKNSRSEFLGGGETPQIIEISPPPPADSGE